VARLVRRADLRWLGLEGSVDCLPALIGILSGGAIVDLEHVPELPRGFDAVLAADTLEHLSDPGRMLRLIHDALPPGAPFVLSVPNIANLYVRLNLLVGRFPYADRGLLDRTHRRLLHPPPAAPAAARRRLPHRARDGLDRPAAARPAAAAARPD
jgi:SAM-dependent methyltransferase